MYKEVKVRGKNHRIKEGGSEIRKVKSKEVKSARDRKRESREE